ncbi:MAG: hypothetical protein HQ503_15000 [Rhodospirillales bacterium]|nr:hypothetical protein [Rhodospirillales bacterium]
MEALAAAATHLDIHSMRRLQYALDQIKAPHGMDDEPVSFDSAEACARLEELIGQ